jgi:hypothetical protein
MKQTRALVRLTADNCTMRDVSYSIVIALRGSHEELFDKLIQMLRPNTRLEDTTRVLWQAELFKPLSFPTAPIGPVELFWVTAECLWVICHPLLRDSILECTGAELNSEVIDGELVLFEILGPNSTAAIRDVLRPIRETDELQMNLIASLPCPAALPPGFALSYICSDPRSVEGDYEISGTITDFMHIPFEYCNCQLFENRNCSLQSDAEFNRERSKLLFPKSAGPVGQLPVLLIQRFSAHPNGFAAGWLVILPFGSGSVAFRQFVRRGVRPFGLDCSRVLDLEAERFSFPYDRPDTNDGYAVLTRELSDVITANEAHPPGKRTHFEFFDLPASFYIGLEDDESAFARVRIVMVKRGTPTRLGLICAPTEEDYRVCRGLVEIRGEREAIGVILSGSNSLLAGEGKGLGLVRASWMLRLLPASERACGFAEGRRPHGAVVALVREQGSQFFHPVWLIVHASHF